jgi:aspartyl-tRNA(Asn)/glutamyl-tRNA(Gln) amidotransferase subunit C
LASDRLLVVASLAGMPITRDEVAHLARLSRLAISEAELDHFAGQLDAIVTAVARVQEVAADQIPPTSHALPIANVFRDDVIVPPIGAQAALDQAPACEQGRFRVPRILAED